MQNTWYALVSLERIFSANVLASYLDPTSFITEQRANLIELKNIFSSCSKKLEPHITEFIFWKSYLIDHNYVEGIEAWMWIERIFKELQQTVIIDRVIDAYLLDFSKVAHSALP